MIKIFKESIVYSSKLSDLRPSDINITGVVDLYALRPSNRHRAQLYQLYVSRQGTVSKTLSTVLSTYICGAVERDALLNSDSNSLEAIKIGYTLRSRLSDVQTSSPELDTITENYKSRLSSSQFGSDMTVFLKNHTFFANATALDPIVFSIVFNISTEVLHSGSPSSQVMN